MTYIHSNIRHLRHLKKLSQELLAEELGWTRSAVGSYEEGRSEPSVSRLIELSDYFQIPVDLLVRNDLSRSGATSFIEVGNKRVLFPITINEANEDLIEVVTAKASAGYLRGYEDPEYIEHLQKIKLPFLPTGTHRAFPIKGESMLPVKNGSYVVGKFVESISDIKDGTTYVVLTKEDGLVYKRVYDLTEKEGCLLLVSDNKSYAPFKVPTDHVLELWAFSCCINTQEYHQEELKLSSIAQMLQDLRIELKSIDPKLVI